MRLWRLCDNALWLHYRQSTTMRHLLCYIMTNKQTCCNIHFYQAFVSDLAADRPELSGQKHNGILCDFILWHRCGIWYHFLCFYEVTHGSALPNRNTEIFTNRVGVISSSGQLHRWND